MAKTVSDAITEARVLLHDTDPQLFRYSTPELLSYLNNALLETRRLRPDLFRAYIGQPVPSYADGDDLSVAFPIDEMFFPQVVFYITGSAELRDDEFTVDARAATLLNQFAAKMLTVA